jgi:hypothetical protein
VSERRPFRREDALFLLCLVGPIALCVLLNSLVRPGLARAIGGERHSTGAGVRSQDVTWMFDPATTVEHPFLTAFLATSDGQIAMGALTTTAVLLVARSLIVRWRAKLAR